MLCHSFVAQHAVRRRQGLGASLNTSERPKRAGVVALSFRCLRTACRFFRRAARPDHLSAASVPGSDAAWRCCTSLANLFACRRCYGLAYASRRKALYFRDIDKALKIRTRLGGSAVMSERFPDKPKGMHWQTYERLRRAHDAAECRSMAGLLRSIERRDRRAGGRH